jgi:hypothetical protein
MEANHMEASPPDGTELTRSARLRRAAAARAAAARGVPLPTILVTVAVLALTYLAAKLAYRLRDVLLLIVVAGFIALILTCRTGCPSTSVTRRRFGGYFGAFVAALLSIPCAAALQVVVREIWRATAPGGALAGDDPG